MSIIPDRLSVHGPILVNTLGHCVGALIFATLLYLFAVDWYRSRRERSLLSAIACSLALMWNLGSLLALARTAPETQLTDGIVAASFSVLTVLPAVLLHISLGSHRRALWLVGYLLSASAGVLHVLDTLTGAEQYHEAALWLITIGFSTLTIISVAFEVRNCGRGAGSRLAGAMCLFLLALSFAHLGAVHGRNAWSGELIVHHAGIPLAIFVLLYDYRFLLLDTFLRFLINGLLAAGSLYIAFIVVRRYDLLSHAAADPFVAAASFAVGCMMLVLFAFVRGALQRWLTRRVFLRSDLGTITAALAEKLKPAQTDRECIEVAAAQISQSLSAERFELADSAPSGISEPRSPAPLLDLSPARNHHGPVWAQAIVPFRFSRGDVIFLLLGPRQGGRLYLSEDFEVLSRLAAVVVETVERLRSLELQKLASEAELRALQSQINPHFLFNAFHTLYGAIARENYEARQLVLNLADVFRYFLRSERTFISVEEELRITRAYLEIEELRLGPKLRTVIEADDRVMRAKIPVLSIQPLVENAVKHGVAALPGGGFVHVRLKQREADLHVSISNSGPFKPINSHGKCDGVGLSNVRRRLSLCYGSHTGLEFQTDSEQTTVTFSVPLHD